MKSLSWVVAAVLIFALAAAAPAAKLPELKFVKDTLSNGLQVIYYEDHTLPTVAINTWYHVGSKNEKPGKTGFAHLFEHLMFEGSEHRAGDFSFEKVGGSDNASTSEDRTNYFEVIPSNYLEYALWMESDRLGFLPPAITQEKLDIQRDVVKNERRQRMDNQPYAKAEELLLTAIYPPSHPYSWPVVGSMEDLSRASLDDVKDFFHTYYTPNNASLIIGGDFDLAATRKLVDKYFGSIPAGPPIDRTTGWIPQIDGVKRVTAEDRVNLPRYHCAWTSPANFKPGDAELDMLSSVLAAGKTSRLYKALVYDKQIAQDVSVYQSSNELNGTFDVEITAKPGHSLEEIEAASDAILKDVIEKGITAEELQNAKNGYETQFIRRLQRIGSYYSITDIANEYNTYLGDPNKFQWDLDRHMNLTPADLQRVARQVLDFNRRVIVNIVPQGDFKAATDELDRSKAPAAAAEPSFAPPPIQTATLSNGLKLYLVEKHTLPLVQANIVIKAGWADDPNGKLTSARLTAELLDDGTTTRNALQISEDAKKIGATMGSSSSMDGSFVSLNVLKKNLDQGLSQMTDVLLHPNFPKEELERQRKTYLARLLQEKKEPMSLASKAYAKLLYGADHPYAQTGSGTEASLNSITREDLVAFYQTNYVPNNAAVVVVGDITMAEAKDKFEKALKDWKPGKANVREIPEPQALTSTKIVLVDKPRAPQSVVIVGNPGIKRSDPDYVACDVVNNALGGTFGSRLNTNLREQKGYTYGVHSQFAARRGTGPFLASAMVKTDVTDKSVTEFIKELRDITVSRPLSDEELTASKDNLIKGYPQDFETFNALAGQLNSIFLYNLPADEWTSYVGKVKTVSSDVASGIAKKHIHPDNLLIVVIGDRQKVETELKNLKLGDVTVLKPEDL
ncbi:MAG TPA: pitrilysin family protein [bacterium]|jgi:zinc protease